MVEIETYHKALQDLLPYVSVQNKSFLITGATGLIGSCIVDLLMVANKKGMNNHVYALGRNKKRLNQRFHTFADNTFFHIIEQDICKPLNDTIQYDYIIHGASNADPVSYAKYPVETMIINLLGGHNVLEYGRRHKNCKIVMLSTFEVYGRTNHDVYNETDAGIIDFNAFRSCYPESKRVMEVMSRCYVDEYGVNVNVARLCSIYGPTMTSNDSKAHAQFIRRALEQKDIVLKSRGEQLRTYCYVLDAASGILTVLIKGNTGESYNVSNDKAIITIADVAHTLSRLSGTKIIYELPSDIEAKGFSKPQNCILCNEKLKGMGWIPLYDIFSGMEQTLRILSQYSNERTTHHK